MNHPQSSLVTSTEDQRHESYKKNEPEIRRHVQVVPRNQCTIMACTGSTTIEVEESDCGLDCDIGYLLDDPRISESARIGVDTEPGRCLKVT